MKNLLFILLILVIPAWVASCDYERPKYTKSEILQEKGVVVAKQYAGAFRSNTSAIGMSLSGDIMVGGANTSTPQRFDVVFKCEHDIIFTIDEKEIYAKVLENQAVNIYYKELYKDNNLYDFEFLDVEPIQLE